MKWFRESLLGLSLGCLSAAAYAQEPTVRPLANPASVGLGKPTPLPEQSAVRPATYVSDGAPGPVVNAFMPIRQPAPTPVVRPTARGQMPPPTVVRGARAVLEDDPSNGFWPKDLAPVGEQKLPPPILPTQPYRTLRSGVQPMPINDGFNFFRVDKNVTIEVLPEEPAMTLPPIVDSGRGPIQTVRYSDERIIIVDENGNPLFGAGAYAGPRWYGQMDWLLWWTKGFHQPPLVTTAPASDDIATRGALGFQNTQLIYGDNTSASGPRSGGRFTLGRTLDDCGICSLEATFFFLGSKNDAFIANSSQFPVLARPFLSANSGQQTREFTTTPELPATGSVQVGSSSRIWGAEANARALLWCGCNYRLTGLVGFRYIDLNEELGITERIQATGAVPGSVNSVPINPGDRITVLDAFTTRNRFYGGQFGLDYEYRRERWTLGTRVKVALGGTDQVVDIDGKQTVVSSNGRIQQFTGGLYALPSNIGHHSQVRFGVVPEVGFKLGYNLTDNVRIFAGYDFLYWSNVLRPGDQIDQTIDERKIPNSGPGPFAATNQVRPIVPFQSSGFWAQGVSVGLEIRY